MIVGWLRFHAPETRFCALFSIRCLVEHAVPEFFIKGQSGAWKTEMTAELQELFGSIHGEAMRRFVYLPSEWPVEAR